MRLFLHLFVQCSLIILISAFQRNNVCHNFIDYYVADFSKQCRYDPDVSANMISIVTNHKFPVESHFVLTKDDYYLNIFRIPKDKNKGIVLLMHPVLMSSTVWVDKGNSSLAFQLVNDGYEVWMGNARGNYYASSNVKIPANRNEFWEFSFHEVGIYDIPATIDYIIAKTGVAKVTYIGASLGGTAGLVYGSMLPQHALQHVNMLVLIAPVSYVQHVETPLKPLAKYFHLVVGIAELFDQLEFLPLHRRRFDYVCKTPTTWKMCAVISSLLYGWDIDRIDPETLPIMLTQNPAGTSILLINHYAQMISAKKFQMYDYGKEENLKKYKSEKPTLYNVKDITAPVYLIYGTNDYVATPMDMISLHGDLKKTDKIYEMADFNHISFVYSKNISQTINKKLIEVLHEIKEKQ